jgi:YbbR domain-containing protein
MALNPVRWLLRNFSTLLLAFILAVVVWVSAVINVDPNVEAKLSRPVTIELVGEDASLKIMNDYPKTVNLTLIAPQSVWLELNGNPSTTRAWVDLSNLPAGEFTRPVHVDISLNLVKVVQQDPQEITIRRETLVSTSMPVELIVNGSPPLGYEADPPTVEPEAVTVSGPESLVSRVKYLRVQMDITGATDTVQRTFNLTAFDENDRLVSGVSLNPASVRVTAPINLLGGYRNVIVKVVTTGIVSSGYRLTNLLPSPASMIVFSSDPRLVEQLPGYVQTVPLDLSDADDDFEALIELDLPNGITAIADSKVLVQVSIAAIETSLTISLPVEITGLLPGLEAKIAPAAVDVILSGPVPKLNALQPSDIRVKVDLEDYQEGSYQIIPVIDFLPDEVNKVSILPATVEVVITTLPTPTATPRFPQPATRTPTPIPTPTPSP